MAKNLKTFCVATEGPTIDGREIKAEWLQKMADNYDPKNVYGARVNYEHLRYYRRFGDVIALSTKKGDDGKLRLYATIDPTPEMIELVNDQRQKVYSSIEISPKFAGTNDPYLCGLAITDDPASLGTEMMRFTNQDASSAGNLHSTPQEFIADGATPPAANPSTDTVATALEKMAEKISAIFNTKPQPDPAPQTPPSDYSNQQIIAALQTFAQAQKTQDSTLAQLSATLKEHGTQIQKMAEVATDLANLRQTLSQEPQTPPRQPNPGSNGGFMLDC